MTHYTFVDENNAFNIVYDLEKNEFNESRDIVLLPLENEVYVQFMKDINSAVNKGSIILSIFIDPIGTNFAQDNFGNNINQRLVKTTSYTYPYVDINGNFIDGKFTVIFNDGSHFSKSDGNTTAYWYYIAGVSDMNNLNELM
jgi:hypothetical protein